MSDIHVETPRAGRPSPARKTRGSRKGAVAAESSHAKTVLQRPELPLGWNTTDEDEIARRRWRGRTEILSVQPVEPQFGLFGTFHTVSSSGGGYPVEIRSLTEFVNSCGCVDHRVNGLGTCKHVEGVLAALERASKRAYAAGQAAGSPRIEVFLDRRGVAQPAVLYPAADTPHIGQARAWLADFLDAEGRLTPDPAAVAALVEAWPAAPAMVRSALRVSESFAPWLERQARAARRIAARAAFEAEVAAGRASLDILKYRLLPYQEKGVLHLAFGERALLADDMGLGKTIQAIGACELVARLHGVTRVLVVCPASLKGEWEEQIARFSDRPTRLVFGPRAERLEAYRAGTFYTIVNYEQVLPDADDINALLKPDIVVLDEAQRIKNWQIKTARRVKALQSPYAFVLTGTPIENRIDELYSIIGYLDPEVLGPLFRFNREFYDLDERGRPVGYHNLSALKDRIAPLMLRRRKADVEQDLPGRTVKTFFVPMADEQRRRYEDYKSSADAIAARAQRRPLTKQEFERLQMLLACMRMVCDTPAILDPTCRISPKLEELERILEDLLEDPDAKIIIFSEWERMLAMVRDLAREIGVETAWHTGSVPQDRRRAEIARFKADPACRLFLSTDSGSVGLNLQVANAVINMDLPWNPAKLEQRVARAWRKNQMRSVTVINLVTQGSIEHNMLHLIGAKQALADGLVDGLGDLSAVALPSGRGAFLSRLNELMAEPAAPPRIIRPEETLVADLQQRYGDTLLLVEARPGQQGRLQVLVVVDAEAAALAEERARLAQVEGLAVTLLDAATFATMRDLEAAGVVSFGPTPRLLHSAAGLAQPSAEEAAAAEADQNIARLLNEARRAAAMARMLCDGGFFEEVPAALAKALGKAAIVRAIRGGETSPQTQRLAEDTIRELTQRHTLPAAALAVLDAVAAGEIPDETRAKVLAESVEAFIAAV